MQRGVLRAFVIAGTRWVPASQYAGKVGYLRPVGCDRAGYWWCDWSAKSAMQMLLGFQFNATEVEWFIGADLYLELRLRRVLILSF